MQTIVQTCVVHVIRNSMDFASWKDRKPIASELKKIYRAKDADAGKKALDEFDASPWGKKYPAIAQSWRRHWEHANVSAARQSTTLRPWHHAIAVLGTYMTLHNLCLQSLLRPFTTSRTATLRLRPPCLAGGMSSSMCDHSSSVRSRG